MLGSQVQGAGDWTSGPHGYTASSLPTELYPSLPNSPLKMRKTFKSPRHMRTHTKSALSMELMLAVADPDLHLAYPVVLGW